MDCSVNALLNCQTFLPPVDDLNPDSVVFAGGSVSPSGNVLAGPNYNGEALISADLDLGEITWTKFDFDVVGHYSTPEVLSLIMSDHPGNPVTFASTSGNPEGPHKWVIFSFMEPGPNHGD